MTDKKSGDSRSSVDVKTRVDKKSTEQTTTTTTQVGNDDNNVTITHIVGETSTGNTISGEGVGVKVKDYGVKETHRSETDSDGNVVLGALGLGRGGHSFYLRRRLVW